MFSDDAKITGRNPTNSRMLKSEEVTEHADLLESGSTTSQIADNTTTLSEIHGSRPEDDNSRTQILTEFDVTSNVQLEDESLTHKKTPLGHDILKALQKFVPQQHSDDLRSDTSVVHKGEFFCTTTVR